MDSFFRIVFCTVLLFQHAWSLGKKRFMLKLFWLQNSLKRKMLSALNFVWKKNSLVGKLFLFATFILCQWFKYHNLVFFCPWTRPRQIMELGHPREFVSYFLIDWVFSTSLFAVSSSVVFWTSWRLMFPVILQIFSSSLFLITPRDPVTTVWQRGFPWRVSSTWCVIGPKLA